MTDQRIIHSFIILLVFAALLSGCATSMVVPLKEHGPYSAVKNPDKGLIFVYRESATFGLLRGMYIQANGKRIGALNSGTFFVHEADRGPVRISVEDWIQGDRSRTIEVEPGKEYYIRGYLSMGFPDAEPRIEIVHDLEGKEAIKGLKYSTLK